MFSIDKVINDIVAIILSFSNPKKIMLFGSRAQGLDREHSDIDIAVIDDAVTDRQMRQIRTAIEDIRTLHKIDIVWLDKVNEEFRQEILKTEKVIYEGKGKASVCCQ
jgi:predicted nucleotidyltransferase